jgi:hypothetical protein
MAANAKDTYANSGPTSIEAALYRQAEEDLALGRGLSAAELRDAQQSARASMAARGLGTSSATTAAEILSRDSYAQARESARRNFAGAVNDMRNKNVMARRDQAGQQASLGGNMLGSATQLMTGVDPYARALNSAGIGQGIGSGLNQMVGNTYSNAAGMAGDVASFNANLLDARHNSYQNNQAALQAARMQASAMNRAGTMGMLGSALQSGIQAGGLIGAAAFAPAMFSDRRMKKDIKPLGKAGSILGLTAYEYKYNGDDQKRVGFMAQDVQKVLPEAVIEVEHNGQKRLAIKPAVIGAALAEELSAAKAA